MINENSEIYNFINRQNLTDKILKLSKFKEFYKIKLAELQEVDSFKRIKDFTFEHNSSKTYFIFITIEENPKFCKISENFNLSQTHGIKYQSNYPTTDHGNSNPYLNFDYNKYLINLNIIHKESPESEFEILKKIPLNREHTIISHSTLESIRYYSSVKHIITKDTSTHDISSFCEQLDYYYIIEIENQKFDQDISIKEDGVVNVLYILTQIKEELIELYTMIKYSIFYIEQALINYISKYVYDIIFDFCNLPNENLLKFLENFAVMEIKDDTQKIIFPLKNKIKSFKEFCDQRKIKYLRFHLQNMKKKSLSLIPYYKFLRCAVKFDLYQSHREVKLRMNEIKKNPKWEFLLSQIEVIENPNLSLNPNLNKFDQVEFKLNLGKTLSYFFSLINQSLSDVKNSLNLDNLLNIEIEPKNETNLIPHLDKFFLSSLSKYITQYTSFKGFMNIDVVMNEDSMIDLKCCEGKKLNTTVNKCVIKILSKSLNFLNMFFDLNEGFFHKHFNILNCSYNFNEKNIIHTFNSDFDSSKKNKIRIFDIPFSEKWNCLIANLILLIWKDRNGLGVNSGNFENSKNPQIFYSEKSISKFSEFFIKTVEIIQSELFTNYREILPDFYLFCYRISKFPLDKYNCIDNLCQHFTNNSIQILLKNNLIFFSPYDIVYDINTESLNSFNLMNSQNEFEKIFSFPNLNKIIEPYMFYIDEELHKYLDTKEKKECFLEKNGINIKEFLKRLKDLNLEKIEHNIILIKEEKKKTNLNNLKDLSDDKFAKLKFDEELNEKLVENLIKKNINNSISSKEDFNSVDALKFIETHTVYLNPEKSLYNFSFLLNLSHFYTYKFLNEFKDKVVEYHKLKNLYETIDASQVFSMDDFDISLVKNMKRDKLLVKAQFKDLKVTLMRNLETLHKINNRSQNMLGIFNNYLKCTLLKIKRIKRLEDEGNNYIKIGYFVVNFKTISEENEVDKFYKSDFYQQFMNYRKEQFIEII